MTCVIERLCEFTTNTEEELRAAVEHISDMWITLHRSRVGRKHPSELQVLILAGPNPINDLNELLRLGIPPSNVWAVEADRNCFDKAAAQLAQYSDIPMRLHHGSLEQFFSLVPQVFDIVYFDACGPFTDGQPESLRVVRELFLHQRLSNLAVLATNFSVPAGDGSNLTRWSQRMSVWFAHRYRQPVDDREDDYYRLFRYRSRQDEGKYLDHIASNLRTYYSDFITTFISEFATQFLPAWRALALPASARMLYSSDQAKVKETVARALKNDVRDWEAMAEGEGMAAAVPNAYPGLWPAILSHSFLDQGDPLRQHYHEAKLRGATTLAQAVSGLSIIRNFYDEVQLARSVASPALFDLLCKFRWFDSPGSAWEGMFCDIPFPHILTDLIVGQIGFPYHVNLKASARYAYTARVMEMFTDIFVLDQARYLYDFVPSFPLIGTAFADPLQMVIRICIDGLNRHAYTACPSLFHGSALFGMGHGDFTMYDFAERTVLTV